MQDTLSAIKKIIFLIEVPFTLRDYQRFGIEVLRKNGFDVEVWEMTPIIYPEFSRDYSFPDLFNFDGLIVFNDTEKVYSRLLNLSRGDFVVNLLTFRWLALGFYKALSRSCANYSVLCLEAFLYPVIRETWLQGMVAKVKYIAGFRRLEAWRHLFIMRLPLWCLGVRPASLMFVAGEKYLSYRRCLRFPVDKNTELLKIHPLDYDIYLKERDNLCPESPIAVFVDQFSAFHPDYKVLKHEPVVKADSYFKLLNNFFDLVEEKTGLEVVIAAHPKSDYENHPDYFKGRKCIRGKTVSLIKESKLVLSHCSTVLKVANLFYKPIIFITCSDMDKDVFGGIKKCAKSFNKTAIFIDKNNDIDWKKELMVSRPHYDNYRRAYIKTEESPDLPFWQIVANRLKKGFRENTGTRKKNDCF